MDIIDKQARSRVMGRLRGKDAKPEMVVRRLAHRLGFRFRLHRGNLPGSPDLVFPGRKKVVFVHGCYWRDVQFLGLAVPGASDLDASEELVAIWRIAGGDRFQNYRARFTVLDVPVISRKWIDSIIDGQRDDRLAPEAWRRWIKSGRRTPLIANRSLEWRNSREQLPQDREGKAIVQTLQSHFARRPHTFEHCAAAIAKLMIPGIATLDVTRPSRDGGRDAIGLMRLGRGASAILVDVALEAKCYTTRAVGVRDMSRLISRLRHRQFGVLVTTTYVDRQAYKEIKEDGHPIVVISAADIVEIFRANGRGTAVVVSAWLNQEFPVEA